ncbi:MAG TPA: caspase family protein [Alphaproteobacteria bacterium]|nr:caspase family protein [Alphaproteobacteria bacterium]
MGSVRLVAFILCLAPQLAQAAGEISFGRYHAVIIGNNDYANLPDLTTATGDARAVAKILRQEYSFEIKLLIDATRNQVINTLARLRAELTPNDNLLIYFAGHGVLDSYSDEGYWLPVDADEDTPANWVSNGDVTNMLRAIRARHVLVVADSCYSGTLVRAAPVKIKTAEDRSVWFKRLAAKRSRTALVSGGLEPVTDVGGGGHSVFAKAFLAALRDNRDVLDGHSLFTAIRRPVALEAEQTPRYADIRRAGHDGGDFLFVRPESTAKPAATKPAFDARAMDLAFWTSISQSRDPAAFKAYLTQFPKGTFAAVALLKINELEADSVAAESQRQAAQKVKEEAAVRAQEAARADAEAEADEALWRSVVAGGTSASFQTYLATYPEGRHAAEARQRESAAAQRETAAAARATAALEARAQAVAEKKAKREAERAQKEAEDRAVAAEHARRQAIAAAAAKEPTRPLKAQKLAALPPTIAKPAPAPKPKAIPLASLRPTDLLGFWSDKCNSKYGRRLIIWPDKVKFQDGLSDIDEWTVSGMQIDGFAQATIDADQNKIELVRNIDSTISVIRHSLLDDKGTCGGRSLLARCNDNRLFYRKFLWISLRLARCQPPAPQAVARLAGYLKEGWPRKGSPTGTGADDAAP